MSPRVTVCLLAQMAVHLAVSGEASAAEPWSIQPPPAWVTSVEAPPPPPDDAPKRGLGLLLVDEQLRVGSEVAKYDHFVWYVDDADALATWKSWKIPFDVTYQTVELHALTVRRGGATLARLDPSTVRVEERVEPDGHRLEGSSQVVVPFDGLQRGDTIDLSWTRRGADPTLLGHFATVLPLEENVPLGRSHHRLLIDPSRKARVRVFPEGDRGPSEPASPGRTTPDGDEYVWKGDDVPGRPDEPGAVPGYAIGASAEVSDFGSWSDVSVLGSRLFEVDPKQLSLLRSWVRDERKLHPGDEDFVLRMTRFVQDEVRNAASGGGMGRRRPVDPTTVYLRRYGDCKGKATLLVTLLRLGKIEADLAFVHTLPGVAHERRLPSATLFDHVIVRAKTSTGTFWLDATDGLQGGPLERYRTSSFAHALILDGHASGLEAPPRATDPAATTRVRDTYTVPKATSSEAATLHSTQTLEGTDADALRAALAGKSADLVTEHFRRPFTESFPDIRAISPVKVSDDRARNVTEVSAHFSIPTWWGPALEPEKLVFLAPSHPLLPHFPALPVADAPRLSPLAVPYPAHVTHEIAFELPYRFDAPAPAVALTSEALDFTRTANVTGRPLIYTFELRTKQATVPPGSVAAHLSMATQAQSHLRVGNTYPRLVRNVSAPIVAIALLVGLIGAAWLTRWLCSVEPRPWRPLPPPDQRRPKLGGWLYLLAVSVLVAPLMRIGITIGNIRLVASLRSQNEAFASPTTSEALRTARLCFALFEDSVLLAVSIAAAFLFLRRRRSFPWVFVLLLGLTLTEPLIHLVPLPLLYRAPDHAALMDLARTLIYMAIWITYLRSSTRVAETFVQPSPRHVEA